MEERLRERLEIEPREEIVVYLAVAAVLVFLMALACSTRRRGDEPIGSRVCWASVLDAIFGGNRRDRILRPYRY